MIVLIGLLVAAAATQGSVYRPPREAAPARAQVMVSDETLSEEEVHARAASYLERIDVPVTADEWRALGPRAVPALEEVVSNSGALPSRRAAALAGLASIGGARARELLIEVARSESEPAAVRAAALHGASHAVEAQRREGVPRRPEL